MTAAPRFVILLGIVLVAGCAAPQPLLYPNTRLRQVGPERAHADIAACVQHARQYVRSHPTASADGRAATGSSVHRLFTWNDLTPAERNYTDKCLRGRGYLPIGWK